MSLFKQDPALALSKTEEKIGAIRANIEALQAKRAEKLLEAEDPAEVVKVNKAIEAEEANLTILGDRVRALNEEIRRHAFEDREAKRMAAIKKLSASLAKRESLAVELEAAVTKAGVCSPDHADEAWPFSAPGFAFADFDRRPVDKELSWQLHGLVKEHGLPEPSSGGLGIFGVKAEGLAAIVRGQNAGIIARARVGTHPRRFT
jgi:hypothetical protein